MPYKLLSKSKYLSGLQCPKYLWIQINESARIPETDPVTQLFDQGHLVGELAKRLYPGGIDILTDNFMDNVRQTEELLKQRKPLFEAGVLSGRNYSRVDILRPANRDEWDIIEVKSSTSVKEVNIHDVSFQKHCCESKGLKIGKCFLAFINNQYTRIGEIDPEELFTTQDITGEVKEYGDGMQDRIDSMFEVMDKEVCPEIIIGPHCRDPYECALSECWDFLPEYNIFKLYYGGKKSFGLFNDGVLTAADIPESYKLNDKQRIQQACEISGKPYVDREGISDFLNTLQYPLYYLDFETFSTAIPLFDGTRPYQTIPFQLSLHVVKDEGSNPEHFSFLAKGTDDPRPPFLAELEKMLGDSGSVIVYNQGFEEGILKELARAFPEYDNLVSQVLDRLIDLLQPFRSFNYYHPAQKGSASLKAVLPAITGRGYEDLNISDGQIASVTFLAANYGEVPEADREKIMKDLEKYCGRDTEGMIWIVDILKELGD